MKRKLTNEEVEKLIDGLKFDTVKKADCDKCVLCSNNNGYNLACSAFAVTRPAWLRGGPCEAIRVALKSALLQKKKEKLPTREEVTEKLSLALEGISEYFPNANVVHDNSNRCQIEMDTDENPDRQISKPIYYKKPWAPRCDGTELVWATNDDRPAKKGDEVWYLLAKVKNGYEVKPTVESTNKIRFKNVSPVQPEDFE